MSSPPVPLLAFHLCTFLRLSLFLMQSSAKVFTKQFNYHKTCLKSLTMHSFPFPFLWQLEKWWSSSNATKDPQQGNNALCLRQQCLVYWAGIRRRKNLPCQRYIFTLYWFWYTHSSFMNTTGSLMPLRKAHPNTITMTPRARGIMTMWTFEQFREEYDANY